MKTDLANAATVTAASAVSAVAAQANNPVLIDFLGVPVPFLAALTGIFSALLVRIIVVTSTPPGKNLRAYNVAVTLLAMLGAAVYITDYQLRPGPAFGVGVGFGALGVGIIEIAKSQLGAALRAGGKTMLSALSGADDKKPPSPPPAT